MQLKARKPLTRLKDEDRLRARYDRAVKGKRRQETHVTPADLLHATWDPLVGQDSALAHQVYGLTDAARPSIHLRRIRARHFGDALDSVTDIAIWFQDRRGWSALRAAGEAVALAGERGTWLGIRAPVSFDRAVELTRKSVGRVKGLGRLRYVPDGWTGTYLYVVPAPGLLVTMPAPSPPRTRLPVEGALVRNDSYWRRYLRDGGIQVRPAP